MRLEGPGPLCLSCADLDHLVFVPRGDAALTRRAKKASQLSAVVLRFSRTRRRYERQGLLVEEVALEESEAACLADEDARARRRAREEERRNRLDAEFEGAFAAAIVEQFPGCPEARAAAIAARSTSREVAAWRGAPLPRARSSGSAPRPSPPQCATSTPTTTSC